MFLSSRGFSGATPGCDFDHFAARRPDHGAEVGARAAAGVRGRHGQGRLLAQGCAVLQPWLRRHRHAVGVSGRDAGRVPVRRGECAALGPDPAQISVNCEGYDYPDDPYVLAGSCALRYELDYSRAGAGKASQRQGGTFERKGDDPPWLLPLIYFGIVLFVLYLIYLNVTGPRDGGEGDRNRECMAEHCFCSLKLLLLHISLKALGELSVLQAVRAVSTRAADRAAPTRRAGAGPRPRRPPTTTPPRAEAPPGRPRARPAAGPAFGPAWAWARPPATWPTTSSAARTPAAAIPRATPTTPTPTTTPPTTTTTGPPPARTTTARPAPAIPPRALAAPPDGSCLRDRS